MVVERVGRHRIGLVAALVACGLAVAFGRPGFFALATVSLGVVLLSSLGGEPAGEIELERTLSTDRPRPGKPVEVTLEIRNAGERTHPDVRIADEPPAGAAVVSGTPALATAIRPDEEAVHSYEIAPPRGRHAFGEATVRTRNAVASVRTTETVETAGDDAVTCETLLDSFPFRERTVRFVGRTPTDGGGSGVEFYTTREYRPGDPINRIDWHRLARTGELATVEYREERGVTTVFVVDDRPGVHRRGPRGGPDSFDLCLYAASRGIVASLEEGNRTGFAALAGDLAVEPGTGGGLRERTDEAMADLDRPAAVADGAGEGASAGGSDTDGRDDGDGDDDPSVAALVSDLAARLPADAQVVLCTPLSDAGSVEVVRRLRSHGRVVTVVAPDMTTAVAGIGSASRKGLGARVAGLERENRMAACRARGATVVDWDLADPLAVDLARALRGGGR
ncbi:MULTISPECIES: DUF58 domain-containing protein [Saliphagus]|uniref:DUF58 domain-containing protein n=1 Tax=Saliphagus infecundisoli TaxID=1849069 RepID=A0ABD5QDL7_9EURY|nr:MULTISPECIES: DUF58 domain-containing protein [Saliphagus]